MSSSRRGGAPGRERRASARVEPRRTTATTTTTSSSSRRPPSSIVHARSAYDPVRHPAPAKRRGPRPAFDLGPPIVPEDEAAYDEVRRRTAAHPTEAEEEEEEEEEEEGRPTSAAQVQQRSSKSRPQAASAGPARPAPVTAVRRAVTHVCTVLAAVGLDYLTAEVLRQAKFNRPEACPQLWRGLHDLLLVRELLDRKRLDSAATLTVFSEPGAAAALRAGVAQVWTRLSRSHPDRDDRSELVVQTAKELMRRAGYTVAEFYELDTESRESRELLLALGWLLGEMQLLELWLEERTAAALQSADAAVAAPPFAEDCTALPAVATEFRRGAEQGAGEWAAFSERKARLLPQYRQLGDELTADINGLVMLCGKLRARQGRLRIEVAERTRLAARVHAATKGATPLQRLLPPLVQPYAHLSVFEAYLLLHRKLGARHLKDLEARRDELAKLSEIRLEHHAGFWQWLSSTARERAADLAQAPQGSSSQSGRGTEAARGADSLRRARERAWQQMDEAEQLFQRATVAWTRVADSEDLQADYDALLAIEAEVEDMLRASCCPPDCDCCLEECPDTHVVCVCSRCVYGISASREGGQAARERRASSSPGHAQAAGRFVHRGGQQWDVHATAGGAESAGDIRQLGARLSQCLVDLQVELVARHKANHERLAAQAARVPHLMLIV